MTTATAVAAVPARGAAESESGARGRLPQPAVGGPRLPGRSGSPDGAKSRRAPASQFQQALDQARREGEGLGRKTPSRPPGGDPLLRDGPFAEEERPSQDRRADGEVPDGASWGSEVVWMPAAGVQFLQAWVSPTGVVPGGLGASDSDTPAAGGGVSVPAAAGPGGLPEPSGGKVAVGAGQLGGSITGTLPTGDGDLGAAADGTQGQWPVFPWSTAAAGPSAHWGQAVFSAGAPIGRGTGGKATAAGDPAQAGSRGAGTGHAAVTSLFDGAASVRAQRGQGPGLLDSELAAAAAVTEWGGSASAGSAASPLGSVVPGTAALRAAEGVPQGAEVSDPSAGGPGLAMATAAAGEDGPPWVAGPVAGAEYALDRLSGGGGVSPAAQGAMAAGRASAGGGQVGFGASLPYGSTQALHSSRDGASPTAPADGVGAGGRPDRMGDGQGANAAALGGPGSLAGPDRPGDWGSTPAIGVDRAAPGVAGQRKDGSWEPVRRDGLGKPAESALGSREASASGKHPSEPGHLSEAGWDAASVGTPPAASQAARTASAAGAGGGERGIAAALRWLETLPQADAAAHVVEARFEPGGSELRLRLHPPELGELHLRLSGEASRVVVHVTADRPQTGLLLQRHLALLQQALEQNGLELAGFSVQVGSHSRGGGAPSGSWPAAAPWAGRLAGAGSNAGDPGELEPKVTALARVWSYVDVRV